jgi:hypothetical protein
MRRTRILAARLVSWSMTRGAAYARKTRATFARQAADVARCDFVSGRGLRARFRAKGEQAGWLGNLDSNQDKQSQSLLCYRYTIPQWDC